MYTLLDSSKMEAFFDAIKDRKKVAPTVLPLTQTCLLPDYLKYKNNVKEGAIVPSGAVFALGECKEQKAAINYHRTKA